MSDQRTQDVMFMQTTGEGVCFAHGPYKNANRSGYCPKWPACATDPQKPEYLAMSRVAQDGQAVSDSPPIHAHNGIAFHLYEDGFGKWVARSIPVTMSGETREEAVRKMAEGLEQEARRLKG